MGDLETKNLYGELMLYLDPKIKKILDTKIIEHKRNENDEIIVDPNVVYVGVKKDPAESKDTCMSRLAASLLDVHKKFTITGALKDAQCIEYKNDNQTMYLSYVKMSRSKQYLASAEKVN